MEKLKRKRKRKSKTKTYEHTRTRELSSTECTRLMRKKYVFKTKRAQNYEETQSSKVGDKHLASTLHD